MSINEIELRAIIDPALELYTDVKLDLTGCLSEHVFGDIYAKAVGYEGGGAGKGRVHRLRITSMLYPDRRAIRRLAKSAA